MSGRLFVNDDAPRFEARRWDCLGSKRQWYIHDFRRGGMALGPKGRGRQFGSKAAAEKCADKLNASAHPTEDR